MDFEEGKRFKGEMIKFFFREVKCNKDWKVVMGFEMGDLVRIVLVEWGLRVDGNGS